MIAGDKNQFAIEAYLKQGEGYVFIQYCFWLKNNMIGDIQSATLLTSVIPVLESIIRFKGERSFPELTKYSANQIASFLVYEFWDEQESNNIEYNIFNRNILKKIDILSNEGETFQGFYVFLLEEKTYNWLIIKVRNSANVFEVKIPGAEFYILVKQTLDWINDATILTLRPGYNG